VGQPEGNLGMRVRVGITTRNRAHILPRAIESVLRQDYENIELCVLDDASTDHTPALADQFPDVQWIHNQEPAGLIGNRNRLMLESNADIYISLDDDAWFMSDDEISIAVEYFSRHPQCAALAFDILSPDRPQPVERETGHSTSLFIGCGHALRIKTVRTLGGYADLAGKYGAEEKDLCLRILDLGAEISFLPGVHVWHEKEWTHRDWKGTHRDSVINGLSVTYLRCPWPDLLWILPGQMASHFLFCVRQPRFLSSYPVGLIRWLVQLPLLIRQRKPVRRSAFRAFHSKP